MLSAHGARTRSTHTRLHLHRPHDGRNRLMAATAQIGHCVGCRAREPVRVAGAHRAELAAPTTSSARW